MENVGRHLAKGDLVSIAGKGRIGIVLEVIDGFAIVFWNQQRPYEIEHLGHLILVKSNKP